MKKQFATFVQLYNIKNMK